MQTHVEIPGSGRVALANAKALHRSNPNAVLDITVKLRRKKEVPPIHGRPPPLSREKLGDTYGASRADADAVARELQLFALKETARDLASRSMRFTGTIEDVEKAFGTHLFEYSHPSGQYRGRVGPLQVPKALDKIVTGVFGLDTRRVAHRKRLPAAAAHARRSAVPDTWYKPAELAARYQFPSGSGQGQTIGVLEFGGGYFASDLQQFCKLAGTRMPTVVAQSVDGAPTDQRDGAEGEVMLDVEVIAGCCPDAKIILYFAQFTEQGWIEVLDAAVHASDGPSVISVSWGYAEDQDIWTRQAMDQVNETLKDAALAGVTVCVAAGDDGSSDGIRDGRVHADFPASSPYVLAVGGTTIPSRSQPADVAWKEGDGLRDDNGGSTGGGVSSVFLKPEWQNTVSIPSANPGGIAGRILPDVAANADWTVSPYLLVVDGSAQPNGGTSAATPLLAALLARVNENLSQPAGFVTPLLYSQVGGGTVGSLAFSDVHTGNNTTAVAGGYAAMTGFDAVSGWGTPRGTALVQALQQAIAASA